MKPFVIAFCGPPGSGKSTQMRSIAALKPDFVTLNYDEFPNRSSGGFRGLRDWFEKSGDPNDFKTPELEARFEALSKPAPAPSGQPPAILFETPFGRTHRQTGRFIDFLVWIDIPLEIALARQLLTILGQRSNPTAQEYEGFIQGLEGFLKTYIEITVKMYKSQAAKVGTGADLVIDGTKGIAEIAASILAAIGGSSERL